MVIRRRLTVRGIVQGVGFRPFTYRLALRHGLVGFVLNETAGVTIEVEGDRDRINRFAADLVAEKPPLALIESVVVVEVATTDDREFVIRASESSNEAPAGVPADVGPCADCLAEQADPADRRFAHAFVNCTNCGPRFTIVAALPYDRANTSMARFAMCDACRSEYENPADRRFHAEPICCPACGPTLSFTDAGGSTLGQVGTELTDAVQALGNGLIVAVKGVGGYHLAVRADDDNAVRRLRRRKRRDQKPFAVMVGNLDAASVIAHINCDEERALASPERPIVLVAKRAETLICEAVAPSSSIVGVLLPPSPLHQLLADAFSAPLVLTSGNVSEEPISIDDDDAYARLGPIADAFLTNDRPILRRADDSVLAVSNGRAMLVRRARGFAPRPIRLASTGPSVLAVGAGLKNTVCVTRGTEAFLSPHLGDLENVSSFEAFHEMIDSLLSLLRVTPEVVVHDLHPGYLSTSFATSLDLPAIAVQHHHAHVASCLVEHRLDERVVGVAFDGLGYGSDGGLWGGEFLIADLAAFERVGSLKAVPLPGGSAAFRQPWRMALAYLQAAYGDIPRHLAVVERNAAQWDAVAEIATRASLSPATTGVGRLFDAVAALVGLTDTTSFEGQAAMALEQAAVAGGVQPAYEPTVNAVDGRFHLDASPWIRSVVDDLDHGVPIEVIAARFHATLVAGTVHLVDAIGANNDGLRTVVLTGGVFQNRLLRDACRTGLTELGWSVLVPAQVPPGDGGISLGQAGVARRQLTM